MAIFPAFTASLGLTLVMPKSGTVAWGVRFAIVMLFGLSVDWTYPSDVSTRQGSTLLSSVLAVETAVVLGAIVGDLIKSAMTWRAARLITSRRGRLIRDMVQIMTVGLVMASATWMLFWIWVGFDTAAQAAFMMAAFATMFTAASAPIAIGLGLHHVLE